MNTVVSLHQIHTCRRPQLQTERDLCDSYIELPCWQEGNTRANDDMRFADVCRGSREIVRQQLVLLSGDKTVQMEVETFELKSAVGIISQLLTRLATVYLQGCLGSDDDCTLDIVAR